MTLPTALTPRARPRYRPAARHQPMHPPTHSNWHRRTVGAPPGQDPKPRSARDLVESPRATVGAPGCGSRPPQDDALPPSRFGLFRPSPAPSGGPAVARRASDPAGRPAENPPACAGASTQRTFRCPRTPRLRRSSVRNPVPPLGPPGLEHATPATGAHARPEAVYALGLAPLGLKRLTHWRSSAQMVWLPLHRSGKGPPIMAECAWVVKQRASIPSLRRPRGRRPRRGADPPRGAPQQVPVRARPSRPVSRGSQPVHLAPRQRPCPSRLRLLS